MTMQMMKRIADNIIKHPGQDKYKKIKRSSETFMRAVVEPKGALEFLVEASDVSLDPYAYEQWRRRLTTFMIPRWAFARRF